MIKHNPGKQGDTPDSKSNYRRSLEKLDRFLENFGVHNGDLRADQPGGQSGRADSASVNEELILSENERKAARDREEIQDIRQARTQRKEYAIRVYKLIRAWLLAICLFLVLAGFGGAFGFFRIADAILIALIGGTTVNVLGLFVIVMRHLFPLGYVRK